MPAGGEPARVNAERISANLFPLLGVQPQIGRGFLEEEDQDGRDRYLNAEQAVKFGICDAIGMPRVNRLKLYQVEVIGEKPPLSLEPEKKPKGKPRKKS